MVSSDDLGAMPEWDLSDLYAAPDCAELEADLQASDAKAASFQQRFQGQLAGLSGTALGEAIAEYEVMSEGLYRILSYAQLYYSANISDPERGRFYQSMQERATVISSQTLFFTLELNRLSEDDLAAKMRAPGTAKYAPWLRELRMFRDHQLSDDLERMLHERDVVGRAAWVRLFDETMASLRFPLRGKDLSSAEILHLMSDKAPDLRKDAAKSFGAVLGQNLRVFSLISNVLIKEKEIDDQWRCYPQATSFRNLCNQVEDQVVDALVAAVNDAYGEMSHRYYAL
ncbi:MAG TPA: oligoendopeptidase F, partial [Rhodospirillaceae bacterium]|nr:oligoendopeptidase F [Rhodospirillaceae bacterium]